MSDITVHRSYVEQSNYLLYYTSVVAGIIKNGLNPKAVNNKNIVRGEDYPLLDFVQQQVRPPGKQVTHTQQNIYVRGLYGPPQSVQCAGQGEMP